MSISPIEMWRRSLASEVRERAPALRSLADRIETLQDNDPRFAWLRELPEERQQRFDDCLDMYTTDEFRHALEPYLEAEDRTILDTGVRVGPDFTSRVLNTPEGRDEIAGMLAMALSEGPSDVRAN